MTKTQLYLSDKQVAERFAVARPTVWRWHRSDPTFPRAIKLSPGCTRFKADEIDQWADSQGEVA